MKKLCTLFVCVVLFSVYFVPLVNAQTGLTLHLNFSLTATNGDSISGGVKSFFGNIFPVTSAFDPVVVSFRLYTSQEGVMPSGYELLICSVVANKPAEILYRMPVNFAGLPSNSATQEWYNISLTGGFTFQSGLQYAILLGLADGVTNPNPHLGVRLSSNTPKPSGWFTVSGQAYNTGSVYPSTYLLNMQVFGLPAGSTIPTDLSYTFKNVGSDISQTSGDTLSLSLNTINGGIVNFVLPFGASTTFSFAPLVSASWNYSDALNLGRSIEFMGNDGVVGSGQTVFNLRSANATFSVSNSYIFNVVDYTGSVQFVEVTLGGDLVGRKSIVMTGVADFPLVQGVYYTISAVGSLGVFSQGFVAGNVLSSNVIVLAGSFGEADWQNGLSDVFFANRTGDNLGVNVFFNSVKSGSFNLTVSKLVGVGAFVVDSVRVDSAFFPLNYVFGDAEANVVYRVHGVLFDVDGGVVRSWIVDVAPVSGRGNVWAGLLAPFMRAVETVPGSAVLPEGFDIAQWPAALIVLGVLAIFSWKNHGVGSMLAWVVAAILFGLGWWTLNLPAFGFALFVAIIILIYEGKRTEREV